MLLAEKLPTDVCRSSVEMKNYRNIEIIQYQSGSASRQNKINERQKAWRGKVLIWRQSALSSVSSSSVYCVIARAKYAFFPTPLVAM